MLSTHVFMKALPQIQGGLIIHVISLERNDPICQWLEWQIGPFSSDDGTNLVNDSGGILWK